MAICNLARHVLEDRGIFQRLITPLFACKHSLLLRAAREAAVRAQRWSGRVNVDLGPNLSAAGNCRLSRAKGCSFEPPREFSHVDDDPGMRAGPDLPWHPQLLGR